MSKNLLLPTAAGSILALTSSVYAQSEAPGSSVTSASVGEITVEELATVDWPWGIEFLPDGRLLITEKSGQLRIWENDTLSEPIEGVPEVVWRGTQFEQGGLMDVAVDPDFENNQLIYLSFTEAAEEQPEDLAETGDLRFGDFIDPTDNILRGGAVARGRLDGNQLADLEVIWRQVPKTVGRGHFGHRLIFGPEGHLFITSGERMRFDPAASLASNLGKVIRINPDGSIPEDNPFVGQEGALGDIWTYGHRNILSATFDQDQDRLLVFEMGPLGGDELNIIEPGQNYGWPFVSNGDNYAGPSIPDHPTAEEFNAPIRSWTPVIAPSGAIAYDGEVFQEWDGSLLLGGLASQGLIRLQMEGDEIIVEERIPMERRIRDLVQAPDGSILVIVDEEDGALLRLTPADAAGNTSPNPATSAESDASGGTGTDGTDGTTPPDQAAGEAGN